MVGVILPERKHKNIYRTTKSSSEGIGRQLREILKQQKISHCMVWDTPTAMKFGIALVLICYLLVIIELVIEWHINKYALWQIQLR